MFSTRLSSKDQVLPLDAGEATLDVRLLVEANSFDLFRIALHWIVDRADCVIGIDVRPKF
jgi:hypothetical protein